MHDNVYVLVRPGCCLQAINNNTGEASSVQICQPTSGSKMNSNPSARIIYIDEETFEPLDFDHYYIDLEETMSKVYLYFI